MAQSSVPRKPLPPEGHRDRQWAAWLQVTQKLQQSILERRHGVLLEVDLAIDEMRGYEG
jgi:hypothetical protein